MTKEVALIPGYGQSARTKQYELLRAIIEPRYDKVHIIDVDWQRGAYDEWFPRTKEAILSASQGQPDIVGYSMGGLLALNYSSQVHVPRLWLLSMSSMGGLLSREVAKSFNASYSDVELAAFEQVSVETMINNTSVERAHVFFGGQESLAMQRRSVVVAGLLAPRATFVEIPSAGHDDALRYPYLNAVADSMDY